MPTGECCPHINVIGSPVTRLGWNFSTKNMLSKVSYAKSKET